MRRPGSLVGSGAIMVVTALAYGCAPAPQVCTEIGSPTGVSVTVDRDLVGAGQVPTLTLQICQSGCVERLVDLQPGSVTSGQTCTSDDPDGTCSASSSPDGTLVGFVEVDALAVGEVRVSGELRSGSTVRRLAEVTVSAAATYPNGPSCPAGGPQVSVRVTPTGLV